jgi:hypothetical protein
MDINLFFIHQHNYLRVCLNLFFIHQRSWVDPENFQMLGAASNEKKERRK